MRAFKGVWRGVWEVSEKCLKFYQTLDQTLTRHFAEKTSPASGLGVSGQVSGTVCHVSNVCCLSGVCSLGTPRPDTPDRQSVEKSQRSNFGGTK